MKEYTLNECFDLIRNGASIKQFKASGIPITRIETISSGIIDYSKVGYADIFDDKYSDFYLKENDILMSHINSEKHLGKVAIVKGINQKIIHGMNLLILRYKKDIIYPKYIYYYFKTNKFKLNIFKISKKSVNQASFNVSELKKIRVFLPNTRKQQEISEKLDKVTEIIKKQKEQLELLENLKKSQFFELFGDPIKNEKGWEIKKLGNLLKVQGGYAFKSKDFVKRGIKLIQIGNVYLDDIDWENINHVPDNYLEKYKEFKLKEKDIVIAMTRPIIKSLESVKISIVKKKDLPCLLNQRVGRFILSGNINKVYLIEILKQKIFKNYVEKMSGNSLQPNISNKDIENFTIIYPKIELQNKFATRIEAIQKLKFEIEKSLKETENLYNSLMQKFFSNK